MDIETSLHIPKEIISPRELPSNHFVLEEIFGSNIPPNLTSQLVVTIALKRVAELCVKGQGIDTFGCKSTDPLDAWIESIREDPSLAVGNLQKQKWMQQKEGLLGMKEITCYHVCGQENEQTIREHGIIHDLKATITASLVGALAKAIQYEYKQRPSSVLEWIIPLDEVEYKGIGRDGMGPGFLPLHTITQAEATEDRFPNVGIEKFFQTIAYVYRTDKARWLDPKFFSSVVYTTSESNTELFNDLVLQTLIEQNRSNWNKEIATHLQ